MTRPPGHRVRTYPGGQCPVVRSRYRHQAKLAQQAEFVEAPPALYDAAIADAPDVDPGEAHGTARSGHAENLARCVPLAMKCSTTRSPSPTRMPVSLCQSGNAARNIAPAWRIPSRSAVTPTGGS